MKKLLPVLLVLFAVFNSHAQVAQVNKAFSVGLDLGLPSHSMYNTGFGGSGKAEVPIANPVSLTVTAGFINFNYKKALIGGANLYPEAAGFVPLKAGAKFYLSPGFYVEGDAGTVFETNYAKDNLFAFSIGPGFIVPIGDSKRGIEIGIRYERWSNDLSQTGIRAAYRLGW